VAVGALVAAVLAVFAVDVLADATQSRPDRITAGQVTVLDVEIEHRRDRPTLDTAAALWAACHQVIPRQTELLSLTEPAPGVARLTMDPALGEHGRRRFTGCLEDAVLDNVAARVVSVRATNR
jgi:hypothetical protein